MTTDLNTKIEMLLGSSVEQYCKLQQHAEDMLEQIDNGDYARMTAFFERLEELQAAASRQDEVLLPLLELDIDNWVSHHLFQKRIRSIHSILELNTLLLPKLQAAKAVAGAELTTLSGGRAALAGYAASASSKRVVRQFG